MTFEEWKRRVEAYIIRKLGIDSEALPDWDFQRAWKDGMAPSKAAAACIAAARRF